jgi:hypothetical protein
MGNVGSISRRSTRSFPIGLLAAILTTSCIVLPAGGHRPYKDKTTGLFVVVGVTTKDEIIEKLGSPRSALLLEDGSLLTYQASGFTRWAVYEAAGRGGGGGETFSVSYRYVLRVFLSDENTVTRTDVTRVRSNKFLNSKGCPAADLCYDHGEWVFLASRGMERRTRESAVPNDLCAIFIYSDAKLYVAIDDRPGVMLLNEGSFIHQLMSPGVHQVCMHQTEFEFKCEAGHPYFVRVESDGSMRLVSADVGRDETRNRRLVLTAQPSEPRIPTFVSAIPSSVVGQVHQVVNSLSSPYCPKT